MSEYSSPVCRIDLVESKGPLAAFLTNEYQYSTGYSTGLIIPDFNYLTQLRLPDKSKFKPPVFGLTLVRANRYERDRLVGIVDYYRLLESLSQGLERNDFLFPDPKKLQIILERIQTIQEGKDKPDLISSNVLLDLETQNKFPIVGPIDSYIYCLIDTTTFRQLRPTE